MFYSSEIILHISVNVKGVLVIFIKDSTKFIRVSKLDSSEYQVITVLMYFIADVYGDWTILLIVDELISYFLITPSSVCLFFFNCLSIHTIWLFERCWDFVRFIRDFSTSNEKSDWYESNSLSSFCSILYKAYYLMLQMCLCKYLGCHYSKDWSSQMLNPTQKYEPDLDQNQETFLILLLLCR